MSLFYINAVAKSDRLLARALSTDPLRGGFTQPDHKAAECSILYTPEIGDGLSRFPPNFLEPYR